MAAMSYLAEKSGEGPVSSKAIADHRNLSAVHVAKVLTRLSAAGLVAGARGASGGYWLATAPAEISVAEIIEPFEQSRHGLQCPFGPGWCGEREPCPLHEAMAALQEHNRRALTAMTLEVFLKK